MIVPTPAGAFSMSAWPKRKEIGWACLETQE